ncbi:MAG TPA: hypothetical protein VFE65_01420 [Pseudonocardia sp.]|jgi:hypothetical protein|nr:hypothetical protein [Pseudonocardia sp.]
MTPLFAPQIEARHTMPVQRTSNASAWTPIPPRVTYIVHRPAAFVPLCWAVGVLAVFGTVVSDLLIVAGIVAFALLIAGILWSRGIAMAAARTEEARTRPGRHAAPVLAGAELTELSY